MTWRHGAVAKICACRTDMQPFLTSFVLFQSDNGELAVAESTSAFALYPQRISAGKGKIAVCITVPAPIYREATRLCIISMHHESMALTIRFATVKHRTTSFQFRIDHPLPVIILVAGTVFHAYSLVITEISRRRKGRFGDR